MWSAYWVVCMGILTITQAAFEDFVIKSKTDLTRFGMTADATTEDDTYDMETFDSCGAGMPQDYEEVVDLSTFQAALQNGEIDVNALKMYLLKMTEDPALMQYLQNAAYNHISDEADDNYNTPLLLTQQHHYEMCD